MAGITCGGSIDCLGAGDRISCGSWIAVGKSKANFGVAGGITTAGLWGHLVYKAKATNVAVKGTGVTAYRSTGARSRHIECTADIGGTAGTYAVDVTDNSGTTSPDTFAIKVSTGYAASGPLGGGDITLDLAAPCP